MQNFLPRFPKIELICNTLYKISRTDLKLMFSDSDSKRRLGVEHSYTVDIYIDNVRDGGLPRVVFNRFLAISLPLMLSKTLVQLKLVLPYVLRTISNDFVALI